MQSSTITVKVKHLTDKVYEIEIDPSLSILDLKQVLSIESGVPPEDQKIIFKGNEKSSTFGNPDRKNA